MNLNEEITKENSNFAPENHQYGAMAIFWGWLAKGIRCPIWGPAMNKTIRILWLNPQTNYLCISRQGPGWETGNTVTAMMHISDLRECVWLNQGFLFLPNMNSTELELVSWNGMRFRLELRNRPMLDYFRWRMAELVLAIDKLQTQALHRLSRAIDPSLTVEQKSAFELLTLETNARTELDPWSDTGDELVMYEMVAKRRTAQFSCGPPACLAPWCCLSKVLCIKSEPDAYFPTHAADNGCLGCYPSINKEMTDGTEARLLANDCQSVWGA